MNGFLQNIDRTPAKFISTMREFLNKREKQFIYAAASKDNFELSDELEITEMPGYDNKQKLKIMEIARMTKKESIYLSNEILEQMVLDDAEYSGLWGIELKLKMLIDEVQYEKQMYDDESSTFAVTHEKYQEIITSVAVPLTLLCGLGTGLGVSVTCDLESFCVERVSVSQTADGKGVKLFSDLRKDTHKAS